MGCRWAITGFTKIVTLSIDSIASQQPQDRGCLVTVCVGYVSDAKLETNHYEVIRTFITRDVEKGTKICSWSIG